MQQRKSLNDPITSLVLGLIINRNPPIMRRDSEGDISSRYSDADLVLEGLRHDRSVKDQSIFKKTDAEKKQLKNLKANHSGYNKKLNPYNEKKAIMGHIKQLLDDPKYKVRMNATFKVVGI